MSDLLFMKLKGIDGEEPIGSDQKLVRIQTYSHAVSQTVAPLRPSVGESTLLRRGLGDQHQFVVTRHFDKVSPKLFDAASAGIVFEFVVIFYCTVMPDSKGEKSDPEPLLKIVMKNAIISQFEYGFVDTWPQETLSFNYMSIGWDTKWPDPTDGKVASLSPAGWNGEKNVPGSLLAPSDLDWKK